MAVPEKPLSEALIAKIIGSGDEAMVLAHGYTLDQSVWDKILPVLAQHYRVLVFDWPFAVDIKDPNLFDPLKYTSYGGFADDLIALIDEFSLKSTVFMGHSMSGMIGCIASIKRPDLLVGASPRYINTEGFEGGLQSSDVDNLVAKMQSNPDWATSFASLIIDAKDTLYFDKVVNYLKLMRLEIAIPLANAAFRSD